MAVSGSNAKDFFEKKLEDYNEVFSDIVNVLMFGGKTVVKENELETGMARSSYQVEGKFEEQERDIIKYWKSFFFTIFAIFCADFRRLPLFFWHFPIARRLLNKIQVLNKKDSDGKKQCTSGNYAY